jgi:transmembrane sensor
MDQQERNEYLIDKYLQGSLTEAEQLELAASQSLSDQHTGNVERIASLIAKYPDGGLSPLEQQELDQWLDASLRNRERLSRYADTTQLQQRVQEYEENKTAVYQRIQEQLFTPKAAGSSSMIRKMWRYMAAAAVLVLLAFTAYRWFYQANKQPVDTNNTTIGFKNDVAPGKEKARLILGDGRVVDLDTLSNGALALQGNSQVSKQNGLISYESAGKSGEVVYNTISVPRGGRYQLLLPDGSHVWLNAASSLRYPSAFTGTQRRVELDGEAYFEVSPLPAYPGGGGEKAAKIPFIVQVNGTEVEVLGTHFNIMGYKDEASINTTLLEGAVKVSKGDHRQLLKPGQQAQLKASGAITLIKEADTEKAVAWKNGAFKFDGSDIATIMRQAARWYDIDVEYKGTVNEEFYGTIGQEMNLSQILSVLEKTGLVHFTIEGRKVTVLP